MQVCFSTTEDTKGESTEGTELYWFLYPLFMSSQTAGILFLTKVII